MSETVFIIGAGTSKQAGAPLMNEFLDVADTLRKPPNPHNEDLELVFRGIDALQAVHSKATMDLMNLESVYAAFEMAALLGRLQPLDAAEVKKLPGAMARLITTTLDARLLFPIVNKRIDAPSPYGKIAELVRENTQKRRRVTVSFITFNYDLCLDYALFSKGLNTNYCLSENEEGVRLLKLHGSLNWAKCPKCEVVVPWQLSDFFSTRHFMLDSTTFQLNVASRFGEKKHCEDSGLLSDPFIAPPTWNKTNYHAQLESVWKAAATGLSDAENIVICGYSLPDTDQLFRYLYALGSVGKPQLKKFWVINPDRSLEAKFRNLCGPLALARFQFLANRIENELNLVSSLLGV